MREERVKGFSCWWNNAVQKGGNIQIHCVLGRVSVGNIDQLELTGWKIQFTILCAFFWGHQIDNCCWWMSFLFYGAEFQFRIFRDCWVGEDDTGMDIWDIRYRGNNVATAVDKWQYGTACAWFAPFMSQSHGKATMSDDKSSLNRHTMLKLQMATRFILKLVMKSPKWLKCRRSIKYH